MVYIIRDFSFGLSSYWILLNDFRWACYKVVFWSCAEERHSYSSDLNTVKGKGLVDTLCPPLSRYNVGAVSQIQSRYMLRLLTLKPRANGRHIVRQHNSQHCWVLYVASVWTACCMLLRKV